MTDLSQPQTPTAENSATHQTTPLGRMPMPWERRLGFILGSYFMGYVSIIAYEKQPDGSGFLIGLAITFALLIASLPNTVRRKAPKA